MNILFWRSSDKDKKGNCTTPSDEELVAACLAGGNNYAELYRRYSRMISAYFIEAFGNDNDLARDLTQVTFIKAFKKLETWKKKAKFSTWLYRIAINTAKDQRGLQHRKGEEKHISIDDPEFPLGIDIGKQDSAENIFSRNERKMLLNGTVDQLPDAERKVISLYFGQDLTFQQIHTITGFSVGKVKKLYDEALKRLRKRIKNETDWIGRA